MFAGLIHFSFKLKLLQRAEGLRPGRMMRHLLLILALFVSSLEGVSPPQELSTVLATCLCQKYKKWSPFRSFLSQFVVTQDVPVLMEGRRALMANVGATGRHIRGATDVSCVTQQQSPCRAPSLTEEVAAEVKNCLVLTNFNDESTQFPYPCSLLTCWPMSQGRILRTENLRQAVIGQCEFQVLVSNRKSKGKMYMFGFDIAIRLDYFTGRTEAFSLRRYGTEVTGITKEGTAGLYFRQMAPGGDEHVDYEDDVNGVFITNSFHPQNKQT
ncbi:hypothetical protein RRG08_055502 [Elysia crispata]|uniref:Uncharacterized protein n=1 Tax=Elysia crispata TaxID=231223 RepID=A0AAE1E431_9GAST|nr:hypothetical protein RRG08_055502 [Elysia crispata]